VLASAEQVCERIFMINKGRKILDGPLTKIYERFDPKTVVIEPVHDAGGADAAIEAMDGVHSVTHLDGRGGALEAHLDDGVDPQMVIGAIAGRVPVRRIELRKATLEDIFVSMVDPGDSEDTIRASLKAEAAAPA